MFHGCTNLQTVILDSLRPSANGFQSMFYGCTNLQNVSFVNMNFDNSINYSFNACFRNCTSLRVLTLSNTIRYVEPNSLFNCVSLEVVNFKGTKEEFDSIGFSSTLFKDATINYNYKG